MGSVERKAPCAGGESLVLEYINWTHYAILLNIIHFVLLYVPRGWATNSHVFHKTSAFPYKSLSTVWSLYWMVKALTGQILLQITNILLFLLLFCCFLVPTIYKQHIIPHLFCFLKAWSFRKWKKHFSYDSWRSALFYRLIPHKFIIQCQGLSGELEWRDSWFTYSS